MLGEVQDRERRIVDLALHDADTDLPNRLAFERAITARLATGAAVAVAAVGIDRFDYVRGVIGYHLANDLLGELGARAAEFGADGASARISTNVVGVILGASAADAATTIAAQIVAAAEAPMQLGVNAIDISATIGFAI